MHEAKTNLRLRLIRDQREDRLRLVQRQMSLLLDTQVAIWDGSNIVTFIPSRRTRLPSPARRSNASF